MSMEAMQYVLKSTTTKGLNRLIFLLIADSMDEYGTDLKVPMLAQKANCEDSEVINAINELKSISEIAIDRFGRLYLAKYTWNENEGIDKGRSRKEVPYYVRKQVLMRFNYTCANCGHRDPLRKTLNVDHIVPMSRGGTNSVDNLQALCKTCNSSKGNKLPREWDGSKVYYGMNFEVQS